MDFDGTNGSTTFVDLSAIANPMTGFGDAQLSTADPQFGTANLDIGTGYVKTPTALAIPSGSPLDLSTGDFTVEGWFAMDDVTRGQLFMGTIDNNVSGWCLRCNGGSPFATIYDVTTGSFQQMPGPGSFTPINATYFHMALVRQGAQMAVAIGGQWGTTQAIAATDSLGPPTQPLTIGTTSVGGMSGKIDELRITKGLARYNIGIPFTAPSVAFGIGPYVGAPEVGYVLQNNNFSGAASGSFVALHTTGENYAFLVIGDEKSGGAPTVTSITSDTLNWTKYTGLAGLGANLEVWAAPITGVLAQEHFTINMSATVDDASAVFFACYGVNQSAPFDNATAMPNLQVFSAPPVSLTPVNTNNATDLLVYASTVAVASADSAPAGFTTIGVSQNGGGALWSYTYVAGQQLSATVSGITVTGGINQPNVVGAAFAIQGGAPDPTIPTPDVVGLSQAAAETAITAATLSVGTITTDPSVTVPAGDVISQSPTAGTLASAGDPVALDVSSGPPPVPVPNLVGVNASFALDILAASGFVPGVVTQQSSLAAPLGFILTQNPTAGTDEDPGFAVDYVVSSGPPTVLMPSLFGSTTAAAEAIIAAAGLILGSVNSVANIARIGLVVGQSPLPGTPVIPGTTVANFTASAGPSPVVPFDVEKTVISQYANSPTLLQLVTNMNQYIRQDVNFSTFFDFIWNVNTAQGFGLDIWGRIVDISRLLEIPNNFTLFGFENDHTSDLGVFPFNNGVFNVPGEAVSQSYLLPDDAYRTLILVKALANISATTAPAINQLLQNLFPGRGAAYVLDLGNMAMQFTFEFQLTQTEYAILSQSGALPHPAGVKVTIVTIPGADIFGFVEASPNSETFGNGVFFVPP